MHEICHSAAVQQDHQQNNLQARPEKLDIGSAQMLFSDYDSDDIITKINIAQLTCLAVPIPFPMSSSTTASQMRNPL